MSKFHELFKPWSHEAEVIRHHLTADHADVFDMEVCVLESSLSAAERENDELAERERGKQIRVSIERESEHAVR